MMATIRTAAQSESDSLWMKGGGEGEQLRSLSSQTQAKRAGTVKHRAAYVHTVFTCYMNV